jgi:hypothetical protein
MQRKSARLFVSRNWQQTLDGLSSASGSGDDTIRICEYPLYEIRNQVMLSILFAIRVVEDRHDAPAHEFLETFPSLKNDPLQILVYAEAVDALLWSVGRDFLGKATDSQSAQVVELLMMLLYCSILRYMGYPPPTDFGFGSMGQIYSNFAMVQDHALRIAACRRDMRLHEIGPIHQPNRLVYGFLRKARMLVKLAKDLVPQHGLGLVGHDVAMHIKFTLSEQ